MADGSTMPADHDEAQASFTRVVLAGDLPQPQETPAAADNAPKRQRRPVDEATRARKAEAARVRRQKTALVAAQTEEELRTAARTLLGVDPDPKPGAVELRQEPGQRPGWPAPSVIAQYQPMAFDLWRQLQLGLAGTRYAIPPPEVVELPTLDDKGEPAMARITIDKLAVLAEGTAPVLAKWLPSVATTPESAFVQVVAMVFLPPALGHAKEFVTAWMNQPAAPPAEPKA